MNLKVILLILLIVLTVSWPFLFGFGIVTALLSYESEPVPDNYVASSYVRGEMESTNQIFVVPVSGIILDNKPDGWYGFESINPNFTFASDIADTLSKLSESDEVVAVIMEINSPGGTVSGSNTIAQAISSYRTSTGKPIVAYGYGLVASGGYWVAAATDTVYADVGTLVGSIGVIGASFATYNNPTQIQEGLLGMGVTTRDGIDYTIISSGEGKDIGNPFRKPTQKELDTLQLSTDRAYDVFVAHVLGNRPISRDVLVTQIGAYIYAETDAVELNLIDQVGSLDNAVTDVVEKLSLGSDFQLVRKSSSGNFLADLLMSRLVSQTPSPVSCHMARIPLAYHGSPLDLCI